MEFGEYLRAIITADGDLERSDKWGFREALMRSFRRRRIFPDHVQFMTEDAVRWQPPGRDAAHSRPRLPPSCGSTAIPASRRTRRSSPARRDALGPVRHRSRRTRRRSISCAPRREAAEGRRSRRRRRWCSRSGSAGARRRTAASLFDLVGEVTQSCTVQRAGRSVRHERRLHGRDRSRKARSATRSTSASAASMRQARQHAAMRGPLKQYWRKTRGLYTLQDGGMLRRLHDGK